MCTHLNGVNGVVGDDSVNIALSFDSAYAMPAAVTLRSVAETVQGPVTFYILDGGIRPDEKQKIEESLPKRADMTLHYIDLPPISFALNLGMAWARIDLMKCLPVDRAIYLDSDLLVRKDLRELWNTDLKGHAIAATLDVWIPMGHSGVGRGPYFNSGVVLMDLVKVRTTLPKLEALCYEMRDAHYWDQDPLNVHFAGDWELFSIAWNGVGIGSITKWPDPDRQKLPLELLDDPAIVHFSGPCHPVMHHMLVPDRQPFHAKPWGYAGAPGNPFAKDWWDMLEKTAWKGWRETKEYREMREQTRLKILNAAIEEFDRRIGWKE